MYSVIGHCYIEINNRTTAIYYSNGSSHLAPVTLNITYDCTAVPLGLQSVFVDLK